MYDNLFQVFSLAFGPTGLRNSSAAVAIVVSDPVVCKIKCNFGLA